MPALNKLRINGVDYDISGGGGSSTSWGSITGTLSNQTDLNNALDKKYDTSDAIETDLVDGDYIPFYDISTTAKKKTLWSNIKAKLKTYFDNLYVGKISGKGLSTNDYTTADKNKVDALKDLAYISKDGTSSTKYLKGDGTWTTLSKSDVDLGNVPNVSTNDQKPTFTQASSRTNLVSGTDTLSTIMGKIMKWFADLKTVAFSGNLSDLTQSASYRTVTDDEKTTWNGKVNKAGDTMTGALSISTSDTATPLSLQQDDNAEITLLEMKAGLVSRSFYATIYGQAGLYYDNTRHEFAYKSYVDAKNYIKDVYDQNNITFAYGKEAVELSNLTWLAGWNGYELRKINKSNFITTENIGSQSVNYATSAGSANSVAWANISSKPTTLSGYGITDANISNGVITLGSNTITPLTSHQDISGKANAKPNVSGNMNQAASFGNALGMINLTGTDPQINPNGQTGWHHFINISYTTEASNMWQTQFANKAGTTDIWVRSRAGGAISNFNYWAAPWVKLVHSGNLKTINNQSLIGSGNITIESSGGNWGGITGNLSDQLDLKEALDLKADIESPTFHNTVTFVDDPITLASTTVEANGVTVSDLSSGGSTMSITADDIKKDGVSVIGGIKPTVLWTNPSPTANFASQTVRLSQFAEDFDYISIVFKNTAAGARYNSTGLIPSGFNQQLRYSVQYNFIRDVDFEGISGGAIVGDCKRYTTYGSSTTSNQNGYCIPYQIIGWK